jgi:4a-hydroxytetrahydrobiopterin dehydratase
MTNLLGNEEVTEMLARLPDWRRVGDEIRAWYQAADFVAAIALVDQVAGRAEAAGHHPDIDIRWNKVSFVLSTHSAGGLTAKDMSLASEISALSAAAGAVAVEIG